MVNDSMKSNKIIGMIQPKTLASGDNSPKLHEVGCLGKITSFKETEDGRYLIELKGIIRFKNMAIVAEIILAIRCNFLIKYAVIITKKKYENIVKSKNTLVLSLALKFTLTNASAKR